MTINSGAPSRPLKHISLSCDLAVAGGGLSGICTAVTAARAGLKVVLVQDRSVLGGNASSEVRLWILGATSHMGNNNRWAREGGVIDEILVENLYRNPEGNPVLIDALLLEFVTREPNITLLLNTAIHDLEKSSPDTIKSLRGFCAQNSTNYDIVAPLFCDSTGDGIVGFLAGAAFRIGAEARSEFDEGMAPDVANAHLLGHSLYFYTRDTGRPVRFVPPSFALDDITKIPRYREFNTREHGCKLWWIEYGGKLDTVHDTEEIKWELWKVVYGVWNHIKNSGEFPDAATLTLEWIGMVPGKRESRRFEGDTMLTQQDIVEQRAHPDAVSVGGWAIDLHPADGVFSDLPGCTQFHAKGVFGIPYRTLYSRNISNLFLGGRIISASHVAFASTRVMATCASNGQAVGMAAVICRQQGLQPRELLAPAAMAALQRELLKAGQYIPAVTLNDPTDLTGSARLSSTSALKLGHLPASGQHLPLTASWAMMLPLPAGPVPQVSCFVEVSAATTLVAELRVSGKPTNHTPDRTLARLEVALAPGSRRLDFDFPGEMPTTAYAFVVLHANPAVSVALSDQRVTGILAVTHGVNKAVAKSAVQSPPAHSGIDTFEFWTPRRRPAGENLAVEITPPLAVFGPENVRNGVARPVEKPNAWVADPADAHPALTLRWDSPQTLLKIVLGFDTDFDHPLESVLMGHPESVMPFCVSHYRIIDESGRVIVAVTNNHQTRREHVLPASVTTSRLRIEIDHPGPSVPAALFEVRVYGLA